MKRAKTNSDNIDQKPFIHKVWFEKHENVKPIPEKTSYGDGTDENY